MQKVLKAYHFFNMFKRLGIYISATGLIFMMFFITFDVLSRNLFSTSIRGGFEIVQNYLMPIIFFPSLVFVYASGILPKMDLLWNRIKENLQKRLLFIMLGLESIIFILLAIYSFEYALQGLAKKAAFPATGSLYIIYPFYFLVPLSFIGLLIENIFIIIKNINVKNISFTMEVYQ